MNIFLKKWSGVVLLFEKQNVIYLIVMMFSGADFLLQYLYNWSILS